VKKILMLVLVSLISCTQSDQKQEDKKAEEVAGTVQNTGLLTWTVPAGWEQKPSPSAMRLAQFMLPKVEDDSEDASVVVFYFDGEGGGVDANLERWTNQFKAEGRTVTEKEKSEVNNLKLTTISITGTYLYKPMPMAPTATEKPGSKMLAAVLEGNRGPWFVKFVGPEKTVQKWEESYKSFLQSFKENTSS